MVKAVAEHQAQAKLIVETANQPGSCFGEHCIQML